MAVSDRPLQNLRGAEIARLIDYTLLKPEASRDQVIKLCDEAQLHHFASVCVNPVYVKLCVERLKNVADIAVCTGVGFPLGAVLPEVKAFEAERAIADGATEIDMVQNVGALKSGDIALLRRDMGEVVAVVHAHGATCKVILETALLSDEEIETACRVAKEIGADFVKTSTGFGPGGATVEAVALMRRTVGPEMGVKASGGIRTYADAKAMIAAGATRLGASAGVQIVKEAAEQAVNQTTGDSISPVMPAGR
jgi:deoxyribose-phosphate aldolase